MSKPLEGQCQCGEVRYRVNGAPATVFACHCSECQRQSASAFGMALWVRQAELDIVRGEPRHWVRTMPSGRRMECSFCPSCGTRLFHRTLGQPDILSIKPGTLDDTSWLKPVAHIWTASAQSWVTFDPGTLQYAGNPGDFADLIAAWEHGGHGREGGAR